eukprot:gene12274-biopygen16923
MSIQRRARTIQIAAVVRLFRQMRAFTTPVDRSKSAAYATIAWADRHMTRCRKMEGCVGYFRRWMLDPVYCIRHAFPCQQGRLVSWVTFIYGWHCSLPWASQTAPVWSSRFLLTRPMPPCALIESDWSSRTCLKEILTGRGQHA